MTHEAGLRIGIFIGVFLTLVLLEVFFPRRKAELSRAQRWPGAFSLLVIGAVLGRLVVPAGLAGLALWAEGQSIGLFNLVDLPAWLVGLASLLLLDLGVWAQHVVMHKVPLLWRMHRVHHADPHIDAATALRFHPAEIVVSLGWKTLIVVAFGVPAWAAFAFEIILNACAQFNHANWNIPRAVDRWLRLVLVTPDMHRVHHSTIRREANTNFGFCLSVWDRLFRQYKAQPELGHERMTIGQTGWREASDQAPLSLLRQPLER
ncbi:MAG: sterol desaturase family protein [Henriciella sp.]|uniref:sterol desaturase family protein n=1 Tax=Henriciella sp. TaxID=1968823 RepID=UPI003C7731A9